jgi:hypothetical protein
VNTYYSIRLEIPNHYQKRALYRVIPGGTVERWIVSARQWKPSILCKDEAAVTRLGGIHATPAQARALQCYSRRMFKKKYPLSA